MNELATFTILFIVTSHAQLGDTGDRTGIWLEEVTTPYYVLTDAGHQVVFASPKGGQVPTDPRRLGDRSKVPSVDRYFNDSNLQAKLADARPIDGLMARDFDAVFFPGGHGPMFDLADHPEVARLVYFFTQRQKPVAAVCHGPAALLSARKPDGRWLFADKRLTGFSNEEETAVELADAMPFLLETRLKELGGDFSQADAPFAAHVVVDGLLITGQNPASAQGVAEALLRALNQLNDNP